MRILGNIFQIFYMLNFFSRMNYYHKQAKRQRAKDKAAALIAKPKKYSKPYKLIAMQVRNGREAKKWNRAYEKRKKLIV